MRKKRVEFFLILICVLVIRSLPATFAAGNSSATYNWSGSGTVKTNGILSVDVRVSNIQGSNLSGVQGTVSVEDTSCLKMKAINAVAPGVTIGSETFVWSDTTGVSADTTFVRVQFEPQGKACSTNIIITKPLLSFKDRTKLTHETKTMPVSVVLPSDDATLKSLSPNAGTMTPSFSPTQTSYTVTGVPATTNTLTFNAAVNNSGAGVTSGRTCTLSSKTTTCNIVVRAEDGTTTKTYTVTVTKDDPIVVKSNDATLSALSANGLAISPTFNKNTLTYSINDVNPSTGSVTFNATPSHAKATVSGTTCTLSGDTTPCKLVVTAEDGTQKTYTVNVRKKVEVPKNTDATLSSLVPEGYDLNPEFDKEKTEYQVLDVDPNANSIHFNLTPSDSKASVSGDTCELTGDETTCNIVVKAEDGSEKTYSVVVKKKWVDTRSDDASLKSLSVSGNSLTPEFNSSNGVYSMIVEDSVSNLDVSAIANSDKATVTITGATDLKEGMNVVRITVRAENGAEKIYTINVMKKAKAVVNNTVASKPTPKSSNNYLENLLITNGELKPQFEKDKIDYAITVPSDVDSLDLRAIVDDEKSTISVIGNANFKTGLNIVTIEVTAEDGSLRVYTLNVTQSEKVSQNKLKSLFVQDGELSPRFDPQIFSYDLTVSNKVDHLDITAIPEFESSTVEILDNHDLEEGHNSVLIKVTDKNGFVQYYQLSVTKEGKSKFLGLTLGQWLILLGLFFLIGLLLFLLIVLLKRLKEKKEEPVPANVAPNAPAIEFKPEFNFGSKNGTDDDYVESGGILNQNTGIPYKEPSKVIEAREKPISDATFTEVPYDMFDNTVTKDEMYDALDEAMATKDPSKLQMLYEQERLNRQKEKYKRTH